MATLKCLACGGVYVDVLADGVRYFHVCPPLSRVELDAAVKAGKVALPLGETVDDAIARRRYVRAIRRDENVPSTAAADAGVAKAIGAGIVVVAGAPPAVVVVPV